MQRKNISMIVPGGLNTDLIGMGVPELIGKGELTFGGKFKIGPGGKARNIAQMIAAFVGKDKVALIGKTSKDPFGLWKPPIDALKESGVDIRYVKILPFSETGKYPGIALIPVDRHGNNQIYVLQGINEDFLPDDIEKSEPLFKEANKNKGILALSLELPLKTAIRTLELGNKHNLRCILDPGGIVKNVSYEKLLINNIFLIKPNEHEAKILTGIAVYNFKSAEKVAKKFFNKGIENVLITAGKKGAYFFNKKHAEHIQIPQIKKTAVKDETGCGDQAMATLCAYILKGVEIEKAVKYAVISGTLQFYKEGIIPITTAEVEKFMDKK